MKFKKASIFSLALALALVVGVTTAFATSAIAIATDNASNIPSDQTGATYDNAALVRDNINAVPPA